MNEGRSDVQEWRYTTLEKITHARHCIILMHSRTTMWGKVVCTGVTHYLARTQLTLNNTKPRPFFFPTVTVLMTSRCDVCGWENRNLVTEPANKHTDAQVVLAFLSLFFSPHLHPTASADCSCMFNTGDRKCEISRDCRMQKEKKKIEGKEKQKQVLHLQTGVTAAGCPAGCASDQSESTSPGWAAPSLKSGM